GYAYGGGFELALACDIRVAGRAARFAGVGVKLGLTVSTARLARLAGEGVALDLLLTGRAVDADEALALGLVSAVADDVQAEARRVATSRHGHSGSFMAINRNKRGITLDLKTPEGVEVMHRLVRTADVFVQNYRPGAAGRLGVDYETLKRLNPRLIYCSVSGFGGPGPYASRGGY